ncbi:MAG: dethiobiotin synthase [Legionellales bacterium]|nr:dethiobiotin synthase [Legionellales bacterium]
MKRYFITGTDTDCGKTYVTCQLVDYFKANGTRAIAVKPVASGCLERDGQLISEDALSLQRHNGDIKQQICPWRFKPPISPHLAAEEVGESLSVEAIAKFCFDEPWTDVDCLLIEGAGGLMAPLNYNETWVDFLTHSQLPVILVVGMRLGCLNHALLTELALKTHQIECVGWIANCRDKDMLAMSATIKTLTGKMKSPLLATIPYGGTLYSRHDPIDFL